ncbi:MAG: VOC family protein, partial [Allosphingosinicella sp.]
MDKIIPCLWYDGDAEEAANFYVSLFPGSQVDHVQRSPADNPSTPSGAVLVVEFTLAGQNYIGLNGGPQFKFTEAVSFQVRTEDQAETDRLWDALIGNGGQESQCGWLKDRWGLSWQISPKRLIELVAD